MDESHHKEMQNDQIFIAQDTNQCGIHRQPSWQCLDVLIVNGLQSGRKKQNNMETIYIWLLNPTIMLTFIKTIALSYSHFKHFA